jgi:mannose-1-phosphate guanylyltransferase
MASSPNVVIMAGGGGTRLWPLSRQSSPKQFLDLGTGQTLLEQSFSRAAAVTDSSRIYVATAAQYAERVQELLPELAPANLFLEPSRRDTTAAFATIALRLEALQQGDAPTIFLWSDHIFSAEADFISDLKRISGLLITHPDSVIMLAHTPITPETGFGYVEIGEPIAGAANVFHVKCFTEKPDKPTAEQFIIGGQHYWNMGYFSLKPSYLLSELTRLEPALAAPLQTFSAALASGQDESITQAFNQFPALAIEYTFMEKTPRVIAITGDYGWSDVGNWRAVKDIFGIGGDHVPHGHHIHIDSENNYIYNATDKVVSLLGVRNTIVVVTDDAILITDEDHAHRVKDIVTELKTSGRLKHL